MNEKQEKAKAKFNNEPKDKEKNTSHNGKLGK